MGTPVGGAIVRIYVQENGEWIPYLTLTTDEYGHAETYLPRGFYMIVIEKEGYKPVRKFVRFLKDTKLIVNLPIVIQLPPQKIAVPFSPKIGISDVLIYKPKIPTPRIVPSFGFSIRNFAYANVFRTFVVTPSFATLSRPRYPTPISLTSFSISSTIVSSMSASKISISVSQIGKAPIPQPVTTINLAPSVEVIVR